VLVEVDVEVDVTVDVGCVLEELLLDELLGLDVEDFFWGCGELVGCPASGSTYC
jgi:hypothetical protein